MIEPANSVRKIPNAVGAPLTKVSILRNPRHPGEHKNPLDSYLEDLIERNIANKYDHAIGQFLANEVRAFVNSLSEENKKKFIKIVKAFDLDKENLKSFIGEIWSGGGMRVIAATGAGGVVRALTLLTNLEFSTYVATSSGALQAAGRVFGGTISHAFEETISSNYEDFVRNRHALEQYANDLFISGHAFATSNKALDPEDGGLVRVKHLTELGKKIDVVVGESRSRFFPFCYFLADRYLLFKELEKRHGINPENYPLAKAVGATANLPGLIYPLRDTTFGGCYIEDKEHKKHPLFDAGLKLEYKTPLELQREEIEKYRINPTYKPGIFLIFDYKKPSSHEIAKLEQEGGVFIEQSQSKTQWLAESTNSIIDFKDESLGRNTLRRLTKLGIQRAYLQANCAAIDPFTKNIVTLDTGDLGALPETREIVIGASIPTADFQNIDHSIIEQMYRNLVDEDFIISGGERGKSAYELILSDIDKALGRTQDDKDRIGRNTFLAQGLMKAAAALLRLGQ